MSDQTMDFTSLFSLFVCKLVAAEGPKPLIGQSGLARWFCKQKDVCLGSGSGEAG